VNDGLVRRRRRHCFEVVAAHHLLDRAGGRPDEAALSLDVADELEDADSLGGRSHRHPGEARARLPQLECVQRLLPSSQIVRQRRQAECLGRG
jgi:hypothetical protein